jgi:group I intron endonuclease
MKQGLIYRVTNIINGKVYIGKTTRTLEQRKAEHFKQYNKLIYSSLLYSSIIKYGWDNFSWAVVEEVSLDVLNNREIELISQYGSLNIAKGGNGGDTLSNHPQRDKIIDVFKTRVRLKGEDTSSYKPISLETRNLIVNMWNEMNIKCVAHLAIETNISNYICKRTLLEEGYSIPPKHITQQKLIQAGINTPSRKLNFDSRDIEKIILLYTKEFMASNKIASIMGIKSGDAIIKILKNNNIQIRTRSEDTTINNLRRSKNGKYDKTCSSK